MGRDIERLCEVMHNAYEEAAVKAGWETQKRSQKPWSEVPEANKVTMRAAVLALLTELDKGITLDIHDITQKSEVTTDG